MSRDRTRTRERPDATDDEFATEFELDDRSTAQSETNAQTGGFRSRVSARTKQLFSPRLFIAALLITAGGLFAASTFIPLPGAGLLGIFVATFLFGLAVADRRYLETALAGGVVAASSTLLDVAVIAVFGGFGVSLALVSGALGAVIGGLGTYFGRDLRDGLTRDI